VGAVAVAAPQAVTTVTLVTNRKGKAMERTLYDELLGLFKHYIKTDKEENYHVMVLWALHTHVHQQFRHTPRLLVTSGESETGKSAILKLLLKLVPKPEYMMPPVTTPYFRDECAEGSTILFDELDNIRIPGAQIAIINAGFEPYAHGGLKRSFKPKPPAFTPVALCGIDLDAQLPRTTVSRAIVIQIEPPITGVEIPELVFHADLEVYLFEFREKLVAWAEQVQLNPLPDMSTLRQRSRDKWRVLIAIADTFGKGKLARVMAVKVEAAEKKPYTNRQLLRSAAEALIEFRRLTFTDSEMLTWLQDLGNESNPRSADWEAVKGFNIQAMRAGFKALGITRKPVRINGLLRKGYHFEQFREPLSRYVRDITLPDLLEVKSENRGKVLALNPPKRVRKPRKKTEA